MDSQGAVPSVATGTDLLDLLSANATGVLTAYLIDARLCAVWGWAGPCGHVGSAGHNRAVL